MSLQNSHVSRPKFYQDRATLILIVVFLLVASIGGFIAFRWARGFFATTSLINVGNTLPIAPEVKAQATKPGSTAQPAQVGQPAAAPMQANPADANKPPVWSGGRVTVLVMGLDYRDWSTGVDIPRTDTMILLSIDPITKTAGMLSIPRDMWVNIPGFGYHRINTAYPLGEGSKLPGGGAGLAMKTVEQFIGVHVDYAALIDFNAFVKFIDELGGLDMYIRQEITVDPVGPGNTIKLKPGVQALDGATVLAYARMRYTKDGDFDRSKRQQEVIMALRDQVVQFNQLPMLVSKAPKLYEELSSGIRTNLTLDQVIQLAYLGIQVDPKNIKQGVFDPHRDINYVTANTAEGVQDVLVPVPDRIRMLRDQVFADNTSYSPSISGQSVDQMKAEAAKVMVKNATLEAGIAAKASEILRGQGVNITGEGNADQAASQTTIIDYTGKPYTIKYLIEALKVPNARVVSRFDPNAGADVELDLGSDFTGQ